jgi:TRAP-type C4-dicarboxylate transport system substrate-binding protein
MDEKQQEALRQLSTEDQLTHRIKMLEMENYSLERCKEEIVKYNYLILKDRQRAVDMIKDGQLGF